MSITHRLLGLAAGLLLSVTAHADWIKESDKSAMLVLESQAAFQPEAIANQGLSQYDGDVLDLKKNYRERQTANNTQLIEELEARLQKEAHPKVKQDLQILIQTLADENETRNLFIPNISNYKNNRNYTY